MDIEGDLEVLLVFNGLYCPKPSMLVLLITS